MGDMGEAYQVVKKKLLDLQEQRTMLLDLIYELFADVQKLEAQLGEFYEGCLETNEIITCNEIREMDMAKETNDA